MSYTKGVVDGISMKDEREGQYGKFAGYGIKIGEQWFNGVANHVKSLNRVAVVDKNYNEIKQGMEIEFMHEKNDKGYENIDKKTLLITSSGGASAAPQSTNTPQQAQTPTPQEKVAVSGYMTDINEAINDVVDAVAKLIAAYKFYGKEMPSQDLINRAANHIKQLRK